jgi:hypothetical protein
MPLIKIISMDIKRALVAPNRYYFRNVVAFMPVQGWIWVSARAERPTAGSVRH